MTMIQEEVDIAFITDLKAKANIDLNPNMLDNSN
jgi:hypothetical protein